MVPREFHKVLVANRGEIAVRVLRGCREAGLKTVAVCSEADLGALHVSLADEVVCLGPAAAAESYLRIDRLIEAARHTGADAIHPGYGFLSEREAFAQAVIDAGLVWIGPPPAVIAEMGSKTRARALMKAAGVPVVPGFDDDASLDALVAAGARVGFPLLVKAAAGGGGKGMRLVEDPADLRASAEACQREALRAFGDGRVFLERYITRPRHIEIQVLGDHHGNVVHLFERECSVQRRHQKVVEESPSVALSTALRQKMGDAAVAAAQAVGYVNAGTVEFIVDADRADTDPDDAFYFLEMNTRLQVEHPVTELVTGKDLVALQLAVARGEPLPFRQGDLAQRGHAIEARVYAEDAAAGFVPATGKVLVLEEPQGPGIRVDSCLFEGMDVPVHYDPMLAKLVVWAPDRTAAIHKMVHALERFVVLGVTTNIAFLRDIVAHPAFAAGDTTTRFIETHLAGWAPPRPTPTAEELALLAVAELLTAAGRPAGGAGGASPSTDPWSPWARLGPWRG